MTTNLRNDLYTYMENLQDVRDYLEEHYPNRGAHEKRILKELQLEVMNEMVKEEVSLIRFSEIVTSMCTMARFLENEFGYIFRLFLPKDESYGFVAVDPHFERPQEGDSIIL